MMTVLSHLKRGESDCFEHVQAEGDSQDIL